jgi:hypothetical protein
MGSKNELILMMLPLVCAIIPAAAALPPAIAQEDTSLGEEEEDMAGSIVSNVLGGSDNDDDDNDSSESDSSATDDDSNQDAANTATEDSNQGQDVDEDNVSEFGDHNADLDDANVAVPLGIPINVQLEEAPTLTSTPPPHDNGLPPEFVAFCHELDGRIACYDTLEDCEEVGELLGVQCEGVETVPELACSCEVIEIMGEPRAVCSCPD